MNKPESIVVPVRFGALHGGRRLSTVVPAILRYDTSDPYAVVIAFPARAGAPVEWCVARETVARGLQAPVTVGDVHIRPASNGAEVHINFGSSRGDATLPLPMSEAIAFLNRTYELVPEGTETDWLDLEGLIAQLLAD
jgi:hypothetical protein